MCDYLFGGWGRWGGILVSGMVVVLCWGAGASERSQAQSMPESRAPTVEPERGSSPRAPRRENPVDLPSWAEPQTGSSPSRGSSSEYGKYGGRYGQKMGPNPQPNSPGGGLPVSGDKVPIGGLEWLLAMGFGYGIWKLREDE